MVSRHVLTVASGRYWTPGVWRRWLQCVRAHSTSWLLRRASKHLRAFVLWSPVNTVASRVRLVATADVDGSSVRLGERQIDAEYLFVQVQDRRSIGGRVYPDLIRNTQLPGGLASCLLSFVEGLAISSPPPAARPPVADRVRERYSWSVSHDVANHLARN